jgi:hypothetical protein
MNTLIKILLFLSLIFISACKSETDSVVAENYIVGSDGSKYYLVSEAVEPTEETGWMGRIATYRKEDDDTKYIMTSKGPPPTFKDVDIPLDR